MPMPQVRELEGQDMRETIQDKINAWFVENRNEESGEYPDFPDTDDGGSKVSTHCTLYICYTCCTVCMSHVLAS